jgi:hypothetical protein
VGSSHDVFVGAVLKDTGPKSFTNSSSRFTRFLVEVVLPIKGQTKGQVYVDQLIVNTPRGTGVGPKDGNDEVLKEGSTYTFATRSPKENPDRAYRLSAHPNSCTLISRDSVLSLSELRKLAERSERVKALFLAYENEIIKPPFENDARNPFPRKSKEAVQ